MKELGVARFSLDEATNIEPDNWGLVKELVAKYGD
jgi:hypothetical protein